MNGSYSGYACVPALEYQWFIVYTGAQACPYQSVFSIYDGIYLSTNGTFDKWCAEISVGTDGTSYGTVSLFSC
jgi:hypothetical protein